LPLDKRVGKSPGFDNLVFSDEKVKSVLCGLGSGNNNGGHTASHQKQTSKRRRTNTMKLNSIATLSALMILASTMASTASAAAFMKLGDIKGEATDNEHKDWIIIESHTEQLSRDTDSGAIMQLIKIKRRTDASSVALVRAFLDGTLFSGGVFVASGDVNGNGASQSETLPAFSITGYSHTTGGVDDGMEEFAFAVEREMKESGEKSYSSPALHSIPKGAKDAQRSRGDTTLGDVVVVRELDKASPKNAETQAAAHSDPDTDILPEPEPMAMLLPAVQQVREEAAYKLKDVIISSFVPNTQQALILPAVQQAAAK
jgi:hypothetical protein